MLQRNSAFARLNQITRVKLAERSPLTTYWETWNLEAECSHVSGATFDGTHHGWWVERAKVVQLLNHLNATLLAPTQTIDATPATPVAKPVPKVPVAKTPVLSNHTGDETDTAKVKATQQVDTGSTTADAEIYASDYKITVVEPHLLFASKSCRDS